LTTQQQSLWEEFRVGVHFWLDSRHPHDREKFLLLCRKAFDDCLRRGKGQFLADRWGEKICSVAHYAYRIATSAQARIYNEMVKARSGQWPIASSERVSQGERHV
jgi:hypothetical protein